MIGLLSGALDFLGGCRFPELGQEFHQFIFGVAGDPAQDILQPFCRVDLL